MAEAPAVNETLTPDDAVDVLEELLPAQNKSYELGLKLKLPQHVVEAIHSKELPPDKYLLKILIKFLQQTEPRPTWRVIVEALRSLAVNLPALARSVEAAHFPDTTSSRDVVAETTDTECAATSTATGTKKNQIESSLPSGPSLSPAAAISGKKNQIESSLPSGPSLSPAAAISGGTSASVGTVQKKVKSFRRRFNAIKMATIKCLEKCKMAVTTVVFLLTSIKAVDEHQMFLEEKQKKLRKSEDHWELFGQLNLYWNYLAFDLLEQLIEVLNLEETEFDSIASEMTDYKRELEDFRKNTTLELFCQAESTQLEANIPEGFRTVVIKYDWPKDITLQTVEQFRQCYAQAYNLQKCAMMVNSISTGSITVCWFLPDIAVDVLMKKRAPLHIFKEFNIIRIDIDANCFYKTPVEREVFPFTDGDNIEATAAKRVTTEPADEDYPFAEKPSDDLFCPVMMGLLLNPHLTSCCGIHLSQEAVTRIQGEGGTCPLCKEQSWSTMLNKHFQRQVNSLHVFCRHEDRGCGWQGELATFHHHVESCPMRDGPLMSELVQQPVYRDTVPGASYNQTTTTGASGPITTTALLTVRCHHKKTAPCEMYRGSATTNGQFAYFTPHDSFSVYEWRKEIWKKFPSCPYKNTGLVIIDGKLTAVGGWGGYRYTNKLLTLRQRKWVEEYPPMNIARHSPAVVSTSDGEYVIVIGGGFGRWTATVELLKVKSRRWYKLTDLPQPLIRPSATICGDQLNVIGRNANGYSCSLQALLSSNQAIISLSTLSWKPLSPPPVIYSTAATLCGQLVLVGGMRRDRSPINSIHQLVDGQWVEIGSMATGRERCLVVSPSPDKIIIVGGWSDIVEECTVI